MKTTRQLNYEIARSLVLQRQNLNQKIETFGITKDMKRENREISGKLGLLDYWIVDKAREDLKNETVK